MLVVIKMGNEIGQDVDREEFDKGFLVALGLSYGLGVSLGFAGRIEREWVLPAIPVAMDLYGGGLGNMGAGRLLCYVAYGFRVATAHADRVLQATKSLVDNL